ncbi:hypothetical protein OWV82_025184 [Melia azedarach]|uniref:Uncharacterized protein n=1 Tax=Melia azedarach TaxID=155640 RepID=A0ACC1WSV1_MELAZ|nr:hypothetical protein OWV82_025184 [Melia azedarach]
MLVSNTTTLRSQKPVFFTRSPYCLLPTPSVCAPTLICVHRHLRNSTCIMSRAAEAQAERPSRRGTSAHKLQHAGMDAMPSDAQARKQYGSRVNSAAGEQYAVSKKACKGELDVLGALWFSWGSPLSCEAAWSSNHMGSFAWIDPKTCIGFG